MQIKQQYQAAARDEARQAGQTIPWGAGPRPAYPARVHYEGGQPVVRRAFGPEDLEEYGAARTEQYFERGTSVDPMGDAYVEVDVAGSPMKLRVPLLSENNRKRLAREGRVPPSKDEQIMAFVRAWWQGDQRVLDLLPISPVKPVVTEYDEKGIRKSATQLRAERRALTQSKRPPTEQELMAQRTALRTFWREKI
ncbi:MAG: hypothetical protein U1B30_15930 [Pseudomonadota bacterium]|nr:hypothetical protein [Pseudomonadota bacterium]